MAWLTIIGVTGRALAGGIRKDVQAYLKGKK